MHQLTWLIARTPRMNRPRSALHPPHFCAALIVGLTLAACGELPTSPLSPVSPSSKSASPATTGAIRPAERHFHDLANEIPGFGGYYLDSSGTLVAYVTDLSRGPALRGRLQASVRAGRTGAGNRTVVIRQGQFDFPALARWRDIVSDQLLGVVPGVVMSDADEMANRVTIGIDERVAPGVRGEVLKRLAPLGVPANAIRFAPSAAASPNARTRAEIAQGAGSVDATRLVDVPAATVAGYEVLSPDGRGCTLGPTVLYNGSPAALVSSHCSPATYALDNSGSRTTDGAPIGYEIADPSPTCGTRCRRSDAALILLQPRAMAEYGRIARTVDAASGWGHYGSLNVDQSNPTRDVVDVIDIYDISAGLVVYKTGRVTGTTLGTISNTCADQVGTDSYVRACSIVSSYYSDEGDSGAPVYAVMAGIDGNPARLVGLHWGNDTVNHTSSSSYVYWALSEIPGSFVATRPMALTVSIDGPTDVSNWSSCSLVYSAVVTGGSPYYTYSWSTDGVISFDNGSSVRSAFPGLPEGRGIQVTVTDGAGATATAELGVTASAMYDMCYM